MMTRRTTTPEPRLAIYVHDSHNAKTGSVAVTYAPLATCPASCPVKHECYAAAGMGYKPWAVRLEADAADVAPHELARAEAQAIDDGAVARGRPLRLHVSGDCADHVAARIVSAAARRYMRRGGGQVWSYTHAWRDIPRAAWGRVSILASMEGSRDGAAALAAGYAPALIVAEYPAGDRAWQQDGVRWIPCPAQTRDGVTCDSCRLCFDAGALAARNAGIAFVAHGTRAASLKRRLPVLSGGV